jgi:hypothetical protein
VFNTEIEIDSTTVSREGSNFFLTMSTEIERIPTSEVIARFKSGEFKLSGTAFCYSRLKTRRELVDALQKGISLNQFDFIYVLLFLSGSSMEEARSLTNGMSLEGESGKNVDPSFLIGRGFGLFRLTCNHLQLLKGHHIRQCVFTTDNGETWTGIEGTKLVTRSTRSWIAHLYDGLCSSIVRNYNSSYFAHDIRQWCVQVPVGTIWAPFEGRTYRADPRSLDELEVFLFRQASALITGDSVVDRVELVLPSGLLKRKAPETKAEEQGREKRTKIDLSTISEGDS